jgi:hypothetical protein
MNKTDEQVIEIAKEIWAQHQYPTRRMFIDQIGTSHQRLERLHKAGLLVYPPRVPKNMRRIFKADDKWKKFRLRGSPTYKEIKDGKLQ